MPHSSRSLSLTLTLAIAMVAALASRPSACGTGETDWKNAGGTGWNTATNWTAVTGSAPPAAGDVAWFTTAFSAGQPNLTTAVSIAGLNFSTAATSGYAISRTSPGAFTLTGSATSIGAETSNATAVAIASQNTSGTNKISVAIALSPSSGTTSTFFQAAGGTLDLSSTIAVISGATSLLNLTGAGTMSFGAVSTYGGGTKVAGPTVVNAGTGAIFGMGTLELNSGIYESSGSTLRSLANVVSITGDFTFDSVSTGINEFSGGGSTTGSRTITVNNVTTRFVTIPFTLGGDLVTAGNGRLNFQAGLNLGGANRIITAGATGAGGNLITGAVDSSAAGNTLTLGGNNFSLNSVTAGATNVVNFNIDATGTITAVGTNTYTGTTAVTAGTLLVNGSNAAATGAVSVSGTLGGIGTIGGVTTVNSGGKITGATNGTTGTLSFNNVNLAIGGSGTYLVDIGGLLNDKLNLGSGVLDLSAAGDIISFNQLSTLTGTSYTLATYGSETGVFDTVTALPSGYSLVYNPTELDLVLTAVPEPSTWIAGALVALTLFASQRRRFQKPAAVRA